MALDIVIEGSGGTGQGSSEVGTPTPASLVESRGGGSWGDMSPGNSADDGGEWASREWAIFVLEEDCEEEEENLVWESYHHTPHPSSRSGGGGGGGGVRSPLHSPPQAQQHRAHSDMPGVGRSPERDKAGVELARSVSVAYAESRSSASLKQQSGAPQRSASGARTSSHAVRHGHGQGEAHGEALGGGRTTSGSSRRRKGRMQLRRGNIGLKGLLIALSGMVYDVTRDELSTVEFRDSQSGAVYCAAFARALGKLVVVAAAGIDAGALQGIVDDTARALVLLNRETSIYSRHFSESVGERGGSALTLAGAVRGIVEASVSGYWKIRDAGGALVAGKGAGRRDGEGGRHSEAVAVREKARSRGVEIILEIAGGPLLSRATVADRLNGKGSGNYRDGGIGSGGGGGGGNNSGVISGGCTVAILQRGCLVSSVGPHPSDARILVAGLRQQQQQQQQHHRNQALGGSPPASSHGLEAQDRRNSEGGAGMVFGACRTRDGMEMTAVFHGSLEVVCLWTKGGGVGEGTGVGGVEEIIGRIAASAIREGVFEDVSLRGLGMHAQGMPENDDGDDDDCGSGSGSGGGGGGGGGGDDDDDDDYDDDDGIGGSCARAVARFLGLERCLIVWGDDSAAEGSSSHHAGP